METDLAADGVGHLPCGAELPPEAGLYVPPRPALATGRVRYVGDQVAFVVADSQANAEEAAEQVMIDYDALPAVVDGYAALEDGAPQVWDGAPGNLIFRFPKGDKAVTDAAFASCCARCRTRCRQQRRYPRHQWSRGPESPNTTRRATPTN